MCRKLTNKLGLTPHEFYISHLTFILSLTFDRDLAKSDRQLSRRIWKDRTKCQIIVRVYPNKYDVTRVNT